MKTAVGVFMVIGVIQRGGTGSSGGVSAVAEKEREREKSSVLSIASSFLILNFGLLCD